MGIKPRTWATIAGCVFALLVLGVGIALDMVRFCHAAPHPVIRAVFNWIGWPFNFTFQTMADIERLTYIPRRLFIPWRVICVAQSFVISMLAYAVAFRLAYVIGERVFKRRKAPAHS